VKAERLPELLDQAKPWERGHVVYVLDCDHGVKVGITYDLADRIRDLARASGIQPAVVRTYPVGSKSEAWRVESIAHWYLRDTRTVGEWFHCHPFDAIAAVERALRHPVPLAYFLRNQVAA
jgi:hypothetical protein